MLVVVEVHFIMETLLLQDLVAELVEVDREEPVRQLLLIMVLPVHLVNLVLPVLVEEEVEEPGIHHPLS